MWIVGAVRTPVGSGAADGVVNRANTADAALGDVDRPNVVAARKWLVRCNLPQGSPR
jgi:hypothetical protein